MIISEDKACKENAANGFEEYLDLSEYEVLIPKNGDEAAKHVKYTDFFNVESPVDKPAEDIVPKEDYDSGKGKKKPIHYIQKFFYSLELGNVERMLFEAHWSEYDEIKKQKFLDETEKLKDLSEELREAFNSIAPKSDWERFFSGIIALDVIKAY